MLHGLDAVAELPVLHEAVPERPLRCAGVPGHLHQLEEPKGLKGLLQVDVLEGGMEVVDLLVGRAGRARRERAVGREDQRSAATVKREGRSSSCPGSCPAPDPVSPRTCRRQDPTPAGTPGAPPRATKRSLAASALLCCCLTACAASQARFFSTSEDLICWRGIGVESIRKGQRGGGGSVGLSLRTDEALTVTGMLMNSCPLRVLMDRKTLS